MYTITLKEKICLHKTSFTGTSTGTGTVPVQYRYRYLHFSTRVGQGTTGRSRSGTIANAEGLAKTFYDKKTQQEKTYIFLTRKQQEWEVVQERKR